MIHFNEIPTDKRLEFSNLCSKCTKYYSCKIRVLISKSLTFGTPLFSPEISIHPENGSVICKIYRMSRRSTPEELKNRAYSRKKKEFETKGQQKLF